MDSGQSGALFFDELVDYLGGFGELVEEDLLALFGRLAVGEELLPEGLVKVKVLANLIRLIEGEWLRK